MTGLFDLGIWACFESREKLSDLSVINEGNIILLRIQEEKNMEIESGMFWEFASFPF